MVHEDKDPLQICSMYQSAYSVHSVPPCGLKVHVCQLWRQVRRWPSCILCQVDSHTIVVDYKCRYAHRNILVPSHCMSHISQTFSQCLWQVAVVLNVLVHSNVSCKHRQNMHACKQNDW